MRLCGERRDDRRNGMETLTRSFGFYEAHSAALMSSYVVSQHEINN